MKNINVNHNHGGFTLIEVLVAMTIIGFALPALMSLIVQQIHSTRELRDQTAAYWLAENQLQRLRLQHRLTGAVPDAPVSDQAEMVNTRWYWRIEPEQTVSELIRIQVTVSRSENEEPLVSIETYLDN